MQNHRQTGQAGTTETLAIVMEHVRSALQGLRFGHVTLIVQDGKVVRWIGLRKRGSQHRE